MSAHLLVGDRPVTQGCSVVRGALKHRQVPHRLGHLGDGLDAGRTRADDADPLALEVDRLLRPAGRMIGFALESLDAVDARQRMRRQRPEGRDQKRAAGALTAFQSHIPARFGLVPRGSNDTTLKLDVALEIEPVGDVLQILERLGLGLEMLLPVPLLQQLVGESVAVGVALGVEARAGIAVPVPGAADVGPRFEHAHRKSQLPQPVKLVNAGDARADDDRVVARRLAVPARCAIGLRRRHILAPRLHPRLRGIIVRTSAAANPSNRNAGQPRSPPHVRGRARVEPARLQLSHQQARQAGLFRQPHDFEQLAGICVVLLHEGRELG